MSPLRALREMVRQSPGLYARDAVLQVFRSGLPLLPALVVREVLDRVSAGRHLDTAMWLLLGLLFGAIAGRVTALLLCVGTDATVSASGQGLLMRNGLRAVLARPGALGLGRSSGDMVSRLTGDTAAVPDMMVSSLIVLGSMVQALVALVVMLTISPLITAVAIVPLLGAGVLINLTSRQIKRYHSQTRDAAAEVSSYLREMFTAVQPIQLANAEGRVGDRLRIVNESRRRADLRSKVFTVLFLSSVWNTALGLGTGVVLLLAAQDFRTGSFTAGDLALFVAYLGWIAEFTTLFSQNLAEYKQATVSLERLAEAVPGGADLSAVVRPAGGPLTDEPVGPPGPLRTLSVRDLSYRYPDSGRGVDGVDLTIDRGSFVVVTGPVGAGKTTLLRALLGLLPAQRGEIRWNGEPVEDPAAFFVPPRSAYTPQVPHLVSESVGDNIRSGLVVPPERMSAAIRQAVLDRDLPALDDGLDTLVGPRGTRLSGGQAQRVAAARMFVREADLLVLDDVSSALDGDTERQLWRRLGAASGVTCLVVSHRPAALERADRILVLADGRVAADGTLPELLTTSPHLRAIWDGTGDLDGR